MRFVNDAVILQGLGFESTVIPITGSIVNTIEFPGSAIYLHPTVDTEIGGGIFTNIDFNATPIAILHNESLTFTISLLHEFSGSLPETRFILPRGHSTIIKPEGSVLLFYENFDQRWHILDNTVRSEIFTGITDSGGVFNAVFDPPFSDTPHIQVTLVSPTGSLQFTQVQSVSPTGFSIEVLSRDIVTVSGVDVLSSACTSVSGSILNVTATEAN